MKKPVQNPREVAEIVAIQALNFIAGDPERLGLFLAETGIGPETLSWIVISKTPSVRDGVRQANVRGLAYCALVTDIKES